MRLRLGNPLVVCTMLGLVAVLATACGSPGAASSATPTAQPSPTATLPPGTFAFTTEDGVVLNGRIYGQGTTAIVLSSQDGDSKAEWETLAEPLAAAGYLVMTYDYRGVGASRGNYDADVVDRDLRAAIAAARAHGATKIVLGGASLGGWLTVYVSASEHPAAMIVLSAGRVRAGLPVTADQLNGLTMPKFYAAAKQDRMSSNLVQHLYDDTPAPKQIKIYPGAEHGVELFLSSQLREDFVPRLLAFLKAYVPA